MATVIGEGPRKPPRIMARKNLVLKRVQRGVRDDETEKLKREGFEVQSGVLTVNSNHPSNFKPKQLPGIANDVESYPCRFCDEKLFLTASGLEKHAREAHPLNLEDILTDIATISGEWKKREFERLRSQERHSMDKLRHEARAHQLVRAVLAGGNSEGTSTGADQYEACAICNMLVNIAHPTAMESHQRAHKKNDELRLQLIDQYGPETVQRLTCEACSLVFPDDQKLAAHVNSHHIRRKKYICKFCGHISQSMSELNLHKSDVHNYNAWNNVPGYLKSRRSFFQYDEDLKRMRRRTAEEISEEATVRQPILGEISEGDTAGKVTCPECGLKLNRPRLLFKHMERVHLKTSFTCMVETGGLPTFG
uniref:C2H2-type domain-containing protein n=1 Tax=Caenorhabditis japonica TaxID=281687 RepID=A0A8R1DHZ4_CAEJA